MSHCDGCARKHGTRAIPNDAADAACGGLRGGGGHHREDNRECENNPANHDHSFASWTGFGERGRGLAANPLYSGDLDDATRARTARATAVPARARRGPRSTYNRGVPPRPWASQRSAAATAEIRAIGD